MVRAAAVVVQQVSVAVFFSLTLLLVQRKVVTVSFVAVANIIVAALIVTSMRLFAPRSFVRALLPDTPTMLGTVGVFAVVLFVLAPVLQTLASSWSDEAVLTWTFLLVALHIASQNYSGAPTFAAAGEAPSVPIGFNAVILASVLISSRLPSTTHVFVFVSLAIEYFVLYPIARDHVRARSDLADIGLTVVWVLLTLAMLWGSVSLSAAYCYAGGIVLFIFLAPLWLVQSQSQKSELRGPWDVADLKINP